MVRRIPKKLNPTMKVESKEDDDMDFKEVKAKILSVKDISTKFGERCVITLENVEDGIIFDVFVNNESIDLLSKAYGEEDTLWLGKLVQTKKEITKKFNKEMIVLVPTN